MRHVVAAMAILISMFSCFESRTPAFQSRGAAGKAAIRACALLPRELAAKVTPYDKKHLDIVPPSEEDLGAAGSACDYAGITLQIDPFTPARLDALYKERGKTWVAVPGVGDAAYFVDNKGQWAELYARTGLHVFTIQMDVPKGKTAADMRPNVIALANAIVPKLR